MEHISNIIKEATKLKVKPISTGFKFLDKAIGGYYPGSMTTICGPEDSGKSAFVISQINHIAVDLHIPTLLILNNMSERTFLSCMAAYYCGIETNNVNEVLNEKKYQNAIKEYLKLLKEAPLYIIGVEWDDENFIEKVEGLITSNGIEIVFIDEIISLYTEKYTFTYNSWKSLALRLDISIVVTSCICCEHEWLDGVSRIKPALRDLFFHSAIHGHDIIIGLVNYERYNIHQNYEGRSLCDTIGFEILKQKGKNKDRRFLLPWGFLYLKDFAEKQKLTLDEIRQSSSYKIDSLIDKFNLTTEDDQPMPF